MAQTFFKSCIRNFSKIKFEKPPTSIFGTFIKENYPKVRTGNRDKSIINYRKQMSEKYRKLSFDQIRDLDKTMKEKNQEYTELTKLVTKVKIKDILAFSEKHGIPKKCPASGLNLYIQEHFGKKKNLRKDNRKKFYELISEWKNLPKSDIKMYNERYAARKLEYEKNLKDWANKNNIPFFKNRNKLAFYFYFHKNVLKKSEEI